MNRPSADVNRWDTRCTSRALGCQCVFVATVRHDEPPCGVRTRWIGWGAVTLFWIIDGVVYALASGSLDAGFAHELMMDVLFHSQWIPYTMMALALVSRAPIERPRVMRGLAVHVVGVVIVVVTRPLITMVSNPWFHWVEPLPSLSRLLLNSVRYNLVLYVFIVGAAHALHFARHARERGHQLAAARFAMLRAQLRPHFLFNALGGIAELIHRDPHVADRMVMSLSRLLRASLRDDDGSVATLEAELASLEPYLELEKMRFGDRLTIVTDVDARALGAHVPGLLLQPLVENAIRHGLAPQVEPGTITIRARVEDAFTRIEIVDDGVGVTSGYTLGIGLGNTRARLVALFGTTASLELGRASDGRTCASVLVPRRDVAVMSA